MALYRAWFATKRRKWLLQEDVAERAKELMLATAAEKGIRLLDCETMVDHVHLLLDVEDRISLSKAMNLLKGVSARRLNQEFPDLRLDVAVGQVWQHRYAAKIVAAAAVPAVAGYIRTQWERLEKYER